MTTVYSNRNNRSTISALFINRIQNGVQPTRTELQRLGYVSSDSPSRSASASSSKMPANHLKSGTPPPGCPMHADGSATKVPGSNTGAGGGSFAAVASKSKDAMRSKKDGAAACPVPHDQRNAYVDSDKSATVDLNPLNNMPYLSQEAASSQQGLLSTERTVSSIPRSAISAAPGASPYDAPVSACPVPHDQRGDWKGKGKAAAANEEEAEATRWEYPSPQQFYNALVKKGWETPEENVEMMVLIHNFLNERAWQEIVEWEKVAGTDVSKIQLARFTGRPGTLSPKARLQGYLAWLFPSKYSQEPPFDRHDWIVQRPPPAPADSVEPPSEAELKARQIRYIIDYYEAPSETDEDEATFNLDVRPALDSFDAIRLRAKKAFAEQQEQQQQQKSS